MPEEPVKKTVTAKELLNRLDAYEKKSKPKPKKIVTTEELLNKLDAYEKSKSNTESVDYSKEFGLPDASISEVRGSSTDVAGPTVIPIENKETVRRYIYR